MSRASRLLRRLLLLACVSALAGAASAQTTITGTVYAPNKTDPLPNILVYVATPGVAVQPFSAGPGSDCDHQNGVVTGNPLAEAVTDYKGNFTLTSSALSALGTASVDVVIQAGKWRRQYQGTAITSGQSLAMGTLYMPADASDGDLPQIAVVTGAVDAVECVLNSIGINTSIEVTDPGGTGHVNLYPATTKPGAHTANSGTELQLMSSSSLLNSYDMLMFGCQGQDSDGTLQNLPTPADLNTTALNNLAAYTTAGGRVFATHYEYVWLNKSETYADAASWRADESSLEPLGSGDGTITVDTTGAFPEGVTLANWLQYINASPVYGEIEDVQDIRQDQGGVLGATQSWGTLNPPYQNGQSIGTPVMQFTFDTPIGAPGSPTVLVSYTNNDASYLQGNIGDSVTVNVANTGASGAADSSLTLTLTLPGGLTATSLAGVGSTGWVCNVASLICTRTTSLAAGATDPVTLTFNISSTAPLGQATITASLSGGGLSGTSQCGRVLFNEYHVEPPTSQASGLFPAECPTTSATPAEKFLEFSLYNLSNFVSPTTTDAIDILLPTLPTVTVLHSSVNPSVQGQSVTFTASSTTTGSLTLVPTGSITFLVDGDVAGTSSIDPSGNATLGTSTLSVGTHTIVASYAGSTTANFAGNTSAPLTQIVTSPLTVVTGFGMTVTPTTFSVGAGVSQVATITVAETAAYTAPVTLACSGLPYGATCSFLESTIPAGGGVTQLAITPSAPGACGTSEPYVAGYERFGFPLFAVVLLAFFARRRRALKGLVLAAALCILPMIGGCGGNCTNLGTTPGTYSFTVTGTSTGANASTKTQTMTMTVTL